MAAENDPTLSFDDVDDLISDDAIASVPSEHLQSVQRLLQRGNSAFRNGTFETAIKEYSKAIKLLPLGHYILLSNRSLALCKLSQHLREIPAADSERNALFGSDPMYHAELAFRDAEKTIKLKSSWLKGYYRKGAALLLLERYDEAQEAFYEGLQMDPSSLPLQGALRKVELEMKKDHADVTNDQKRKRAKLQYNDDFDCVLCLKLLYEPVTTPCGHSFCRACLLQAMDHGNKCPICRVVLLLSPKTYPVSVTLKNIIEKNFHEEHAARKEEMDMKSSSDGKEILPFFVMDFVMPSEKIALNIFEPRYRLMVRRVMEGNHRMGMVGIDVQTGTIADVACEVEITECQPLPDGRFYLEIEGRRRCHLVKTWDQDGYRVGEVTWFKDKVVDDGASLAELRSTAESAANLARLWITEASQRDSHNGLVDRLNEAPSTNDPELFSFWVATLLHLPSGEKLRLLRLTDTRERLAQDLIFLRSWTSRGCRLQ
ncbi:hypothetical protein KP509_01G089900 [Ceratopteris richardii]|uniref:LON peptidase N-terminal domain and RING finger protein 1 n=1 Tax=Ceratopteris richardii TaxID=49495 RepID=A0A8T2VNE8_CERRI|nr:hypothetical protein KP509_01G089900 [Ceratopteris richardii]